MLSLDVLGQIVHPALQAQMRAGGEGSLTFSSADVRDFLAANPKAKRILLNIDCDGGDVYEGFKIYDLLRTSGREIHTCIRGGCHSMATVLLLAAPYEHRSGVKNLRALVHLPRAFGVEETLTAQQAADTARGLQQEQDAMLDVYSQSRYGWTEREAL